MLFRILGPLQVVDGDVNHQVACLLDSAVRKKLWSELSQGVTPEAARQGIIEEEAV